MAAEIDSGILYNKRLYIWSGVMDGNAKLVICKSSRVVKSKSRQARVIKVVSGTASIEVKISRPFFFARGDLVSVGNEMFNVLRVAK